jgi:hypothetical protein
MSSKKPPPKPSRSPSAKPSLRDTQAGPFSLPPLPKAPPQKFHSEPPTRQKNVTASVYQSLISVFDEMSPNQKMEFVDMAALFAALDTAGRRDFVALLTLYPQLWATERVQVHELVERLAANSKKKPGQ